MSLHEKIRFQKQEKKYSEHCCVPLCSASSKFNGVLSFHSFPACPDLRKRWMVNIRRDHFPISSHTKVCSRHFTPDELIEPTTFGGRRRLVKDAVPKLFDWNGYRVQTQPCRVWEKNNQAVEAAPPHEKEHPVDAANDHDYCSASQPCAMDISVSSMQNLHREERDPRKEMPVMWIQREFGLQRFAGSSADIRFYTRFPSYNHLMAFWFLIEPCIHKMIRLSGNESAAKTTEDAAKSTRPSVRRLLQPIDEFFLFLVFLSVGLKETDLAHRFNTHESTVSSIIATWTRFLVTVLGSQRIWLSQKEVQAFLPEEFRDFQDTQVILHCIELRCQPPTSTPLQSEMFSTYKPPYTLRALVGMAPHGAVTFISSLYSGSVGDAELFRQSGIAKLLTEDMAVMVDKSFLINDCLKYKMYRPPFPSKQKQVSGCQVRESLATARLRIHLEHVIRRIKQNKLFDGIITLSHAYSVDQLFAVACMLSNYQNTTLVNKWVM